jgi:uncharacterized protein YfiM (DUF2279 family)
MSDHSGIVRMVASMVVQLREKRFDPSLYLVAAGTRPSRDKGRIEPSLQFHQPTALTLEVTIGSSKSAAALHYRY